jgi:hypothetical protein
MVEATNLPPAADRQIITPRRQRELNVQWFTKESVGHSP